MNKYVVKFAKEGYIKYISHLDLLRLFKRAFKRSGMSLVHSQGFNPHPKMGFAQPLSLGYTSSCELLEVETKESVDPADMKKRLAEVMPMGLVILDCTPFPAGLKSLAASVVKGEYVVTFPVKNDTSKYQALVSDFLAQDEIMAEKRQKKTKKMVASNIKPKIREISVEEGDNLTLRLLVDCGSASNLSPEQVIAAFLSFTGLDKEISRSDIEVERTQIIFDKKV